jgi:hypothetical protein
MVIVFNLMSHQILLSRKMKCCYMQDIHKSTSMKVEGGDKEGDKLWPSCTFCHYDIF